MFLLLAHVGLVGGGQVGRLLLVAFHHLRALVVEVLQRRLHCHARLLPLALPVLLH